MSIRENQHSVDYERIVAQWFGEEDVAPRGEAGDHARAAGEALAASFQRRVRRWAAGVLMRGGDAEAEAEAEESVCALTEKLQVRQSASYVLETVNQPLAPNPHACYRNRLARPA